jgi:hypothetical protein
MHHKVNKDEFELKIIEGTLRNKFNNRPLYCEA